MKMKIKQINICNTNRTYTSIIIILKLQAPCIIQYNTIQKIKSIYEYFMITANATHFLYVIMSTRKYDISALVINFGFTFFFVWLVSEQIQTISIEIPIDNCMHTWCCWQIELQQHVLCLIIFEDIYLIVCLCFLLYSRTLAHHCHNIERLDLSDCKKITDQAVHAISKHCAKLSAINLESCVIISDKSLKDISDGCPVSLFLFY